MKERVKNLSTPARRPAPTPGADPPGSALRVSFASGVSSTPAPGAASALPHTPASLRIPSASHAEARGCHHKTPVATSASASANAHAHAASMSSRPPASAASAPRTTSHHRHEPASGGAPPQNQTRVAADSTEGLLHEYARAMGATPPHARSERERRIAALRECPNDARLWCEFLEAEELALGDETAHATQTLSRLSAGRNGVSLFRLFEHATRALPQVSRHAPYDTQGYYLRLYLGLARQQLVSNMDDARDTFKYLKSEGFWHAHAMFWSEWAAFGYRHKGEEKALKILDKGLRCGHVAEGRSVLEDMKAAIEQGRFGVSTRRKQPGLGPPIADETTRTATTTPRLVAGTNRPRTAAPSDDVTMEVCDAALSSAALSSRAAAPQQTKPPPRAESAARRYRPTLVEEDVTVAVPPARNQSAAGSSESLQKTSQREPPRRPSDGERRSEAPAAEAKKPDAAASESKKKRPKIRENAEMVVVRGVKYLKLECVGQGGTCKVYKVLCPKRKTYALKRIRLQGRERETIEGFMDEIRLLQGLRGRDNIIQLVDAEVCKAEGLIYVVLEYGEIDLARLLNKREKQARAKLRDGGEREKGGAMIDDNFLRLYFEQMVEAVGTIHEQKIVHSDLKPANFLFVEGALKLIDFGIAKQDTSKSDTTNIVRDHQVGTVNYMSPEAILNGQPSALGGPLKVGRASDIWSLGCILYQMVYGQTPFASIAGMIPKLHAITDPKHTIAMPPTSNPHLTDLIRRCLERHPHRRITIDGILEHPFLRPSGAGAVAVDEEKKPAPAGGLSADQLTNLLEQIQKHGERVDVGAVSREVFRQIAAGATEVSVSPLLRKHAKADGGGEGGGNGEEGKDGGDGGGDGSSDSSTGLTREIGAMGIPGDAEGGATEARVRR